MTCVPQVKIPSGWDSSVLEYPTLKKIVKGKLTSLRLYEFSLGWDTPDLEYLTPKETVKVKSTSLWLDELIIFGVGYTTSGVSHPKGKLGF